MCESDCAIVEYHFAGAAVLYDVANIVTAVRNGAAQEGGFAGFVYNRARDGTISNSRFVCAVLVVWCFRTEGSVGYIDSIAAVGVDRVVCPVDDGAIISS